MTIQMGSRRQLVAPAVGEFPFKTATTTAWLLCFSTASGRVPLPEVIHAALLPLPSGLRDGNGGIPMNDFKIVVVDDEPASANTLCAILRKSGYSAYAAYEAESALMVCKHHHPALLLTDVNMPGLNGIELAIQMGLALPECRVILFSGHVNSAVLLKAAREQGYEFDFLEKPMAPEDLLSRVSAIAQEWQQARRLSA